MVWCQHFMHHVWLIKQWEQAFCTLAQGPRCSRNSIFAQLICEGADNTYVRGCRQQTIA
jgi:hypothetical protein